MSKQPFYHLRPNKSIDRSLFAQTLVGLNQLLPISDYHYTGFGSYLFDDFKLLHEKLNIEPMISLEKDPIQYKRALFNRPYKCIDIKNIGSTEYLSELLLDDNSHNIFWLDFVNPAEMGTQLADYATLLNLLNPFDVVRITLNANPSSLGKVDDPDMIHQVRLEELKKRVPDEYFPVAVSPDNMTSTQYPLVLLRILKTITLQSLSDDPPYSANFMLPLFSSVYADGQQMLTFTGIVLDSHDKEKEVQDVLSKYVHHTFTWDNPYLIEIPPLSVLEIAELNKLLPNPDVQQQLLEKFPFIFNEDNKQSIRSYISNYKYYPNYHQVSF